MKKLIAMLLALSLVLAFAGCASEKAAETTAAPETTAEVTEEIVPDTSETGPAEAEGSVMTHAEYVAADMDSAVCVETYVQDTQSWWDNQITVYAQSEDGAYLIYNMECSEENAAKLVPGTKIRVTGYKMEWEGEVEIAEASFEILEGSYIAEAADLTDLLGTDTMLEHQNEKASFTGLTVEAIAYKNDEPGDDIYLTLSKDGVSYNFCVEVYLTGTDSDVYTTVGTLNVGDTVDVECFLYWYKGMNPHITSIAVK